MLTGPVFLKCDKKLIFGWVSLQFELKLECHIDIVLEISGRQLFWHDLYSRWFSKKNWEKNINFCRRNFFRRKIFEKFSRFFRKKNRKDMFFEKMKLLNFFRKITCFFRKKSKMFFPRKIDFSSKNNGFSKNIFQKHIFFKKKVKIFPMMKKIISTKKKSSFEKNNLCQPTSRSRPWWIYSSIR